MHMHFIFFVFEYIFGMLVKFNLQYFHFFIISCILYCFKLLSIPLQREHCFQILYTSQNELGHFVKII